MYVPQEIITAGALIFYIIEKIGKHFFPAKKAERKSYILQTEKWYMYL